MPNISTRYCALARLSVAWSLLLVSCCNGQPQSPSSTGGDSLRHFLAHYFRTSTTAEGKVPSYYSAFVDLRDDGSKEAVVYVTGADYCGSGGCTLLILVPEGASYRIITRTTVTQLPVRVLATKSNGWHDLAVYVYGGGIQRGYEARLPFDGTTYPSNPTMPPAERLGSDVTGTVLVPSTILRRAPAATVKVTEPETIVPGQSVGNLRLGMQEKDLEGPIFSWRTTPSLIGTTKGTCNQITVHWWNDRSGVTAYLADDVVYQIDAPSNERFKLQGMQIPHDTTFSELKRMMPDGTLLRWTGSAFLTPSREDILFWVNADKGIAFRLDYDLEDARIHKLRSRIVGSISVFRAGGSFQPDGCLQPQSKLEPVR